jgi:hypothetical protein
VRYYHQQTTEHAAPVRRVQQLAAARAELPVIPNGRWRLSWIRRLPRLPGTVPRSLSVGPLSSIRTPALSGGVDQGRRAAHPADLRVPVGSLIAQVALPPCADHGELLRGERVGPLSAPTTGSSSVWGQRGDPAVHRVRLGDPVWLRPDEVRDVYRKVGTSDGSIAAMADMKALPFGKGRNLTGDEEAVVRVRVLTMAQGQSAGRRP